MSVMDRIFVMFEHLPPRWKVNWSTP